MITFKEYNFAVSEAVYPGNIGVIETCKFFNTASPDKIKHVKQLIKDQKHKEAWDEIQNHLNIKLHPSATGQET